MFKSVLYKTWSVNIPFISLIPDHADLLKRISIRFIAGGLIFKGLNNYLLITIWYSAWASGSKPLKIRPLPTLGGISFEISFFEDRHDLHLINIRPQRGRFWSDPIGILTLQWRSCQSLQDDIFLKIPQGLCTTFWPGRYYLEETDRIGLLTR